MITRESIIKGAHKITGIDAKVFTDASRSVIDFKTAMFEDDATIVAKFSNQKYEETLKADKILAEDINESVAKEKSQKSTSKSNKFNLPDLFKGGNDSPEINPLEYISK